MTKSKIYDLFLKKLEQDLKKERDVIIIFINGKSRDRFIQEKSGKFKILNKYDILPAIKIKLTKAQIFDVKNFKGIKRIEEDQILYLSMEELFENWNLIEYKNFQTSHEGKGVSLGIIDDGINDEFEYIPEVVPFSKTIPKKTIISNNKHEKSEIVSHGTLMAGIIGNKCIHENYLLGIAPQVQIIDIQLTNHNNIIRISNVLHIFDVIIRRRLYLDILLISFTTLESSDGNDALSLACNKLVKKGITIICPSGNFGPEYHTIGSPAAAKWVITVGALTKKNTITYYSGRGPTLDGRIKPDFCVTGSKISIPLTRQKFISFSGTSAAAAVATGMVAILKEINKKLRPKQIKKILIKSCKDLGYEKTSQGSGITNLERVFNALNLSQLEESLNYHLLMKISIKYSILLIILLLIILYFNIIIQIFQV
ncbi:MAG: S8 family serine peptidase [Promethearchaeota archaeon]